MKALINVMFIENLELAERDFNTFRVHRNPSNPFINMRDEAFLKTFRQPKYLVAYLINYLEPYILRQRRPTDLDITTKVLVALNFFASGSHPTSVGENKYLDISQPSVFRCIKGVSDALNQPEVLNELVHMSENLQELNAVRLKFYERHGFPGVVGCIVCTHVAIVTPKANDPEHPEHIYVNRKNYHSITIRGSNLSIMNVCARYPGSTNDAFIRGMSNAQQFFRNLRNAKHRDYFLFGDSGYPLRTWLLTPIDGNYEPGSPESNYNRTHKTTRVKIECCDGILKNRFRCLLRYRTLQVDPLRACKIINACIVQHNICIKYAIPEPEEGNDDLDWHYRTQR